MDRKPHGFTSAAGKESTETMLRDRFIVGAGSTYAVGATGGKATHALTTGELSAHDHGSAGGHTHDTIGDHAHGYGTSGSGGSPFPSPAGGSTTNTHTTSSAGGYYYESLIRKLKVF